MPLRATGTESCADSPVPGRRSTGSRPHSQAQATEGLDAARTALLEATEGLGEVHTAR